MTTLDKPLATLAVLQGKAIELVAPFVPKGAAAAICKELRRDACCWLVQAADDERDKLIRKSLHKLKVDLRRKRRDGDAYVRQLFGE